MASALALISVKYTVSRHQPRVSMGGDCTRTPVPGSWVHLQGRWGSTTVSWPQSPKPVSERAGCGPGLSADPASHAFNSYQVPRVLSTRNGGGHGGRGWMLQNCTCQGDLDLVALLTLCTIAQEAQW